MFYKIIDTFFIGQNTSVSIKGNGKGLKNGMIVTGDDGKKYKILSIAMTATQNINTTILLIEGKCSINSFKP